MPLFVKLIKLLLSMALGVGILLLLVATGVVELKRTIQLASESRFDIKQNLPPLTEVAAQDGPSESVEKSAPKQPAEISEPEQMDDGLHEKVLFYVERLVGDGAGDVETQLQRYLTDELGLGPEETEHFIRMCFWKNFTTLADQWPPEQRQQRLAEFQHELALKTAGFKALGLKLAEDVKAQVESFAQQLVAQATQTDIGKGTP